jgi:hypothetical protein
MSLEFAIVIIALMLVFSMSTTDPHKISQNTIDEYIRKISESTKREVEQLLLAGIPRELIASRIQSAVGGQAHARAIVNYLADKDRVATKTFQVNLQNNEQL